MSVAKTDAVVIDPAVWRTAWTVLVGGMAVLFDTTIVAVALHSLANELHAPIATIQWVSTGYLLALGVTIPIAGWAQRVLGSKRLWLIALTVFLVGSVLASLAWSADSLIAFRVVQGVGGGVLVPLMSTMVMQAAGGRGLGPDHVGDQPARRARTDPRPGASGGSSCSTCTGRGCSG